MASEKNIKLYHIHVSAIEYDFYEDYSWTNGYWSRILSPFDNIDDVIRTANEMYDKLYADNPKKIVKPQTIIAIVKTHDKSSDEIKIQQIYNKIYDCPKSSNDCDFSNDDIIIEKWMMFDGVDCYHDDIGDDNF